MSKWWIATFTASRRYHHPTWVVAGTGEKVHVWNPGQRSQGHPGCGRALPGTTLRDQLTFGSWVKARRLTCWFDSMTADIMTGRRRCGA